MIQIFQGKQHQIEAKLVQQHRAAAFIYIHDNAAFPKGWAGFRTLIHALKNADATHAKNVIEGDKALASFIFPELENELTTKEHEKYFYYHARFQSRLNVPYDLYKQMAFLLHEFLKNNTKTIVLPELTSIDSETLRVFENYYRYFPNSTQKIIVGFATDISDVEDADGITWERSEGTVQYFVGSLLMHPTTETIELSDIPEASQDVESIWKAQCIPNDEEELYNSLQPSMSGAAAEKAIEMMRRSYARFSFRAGIKIGLRVLEYCSELSQTQKATIHGLIGSSANFYQFSHHANPPFDAFLAHHLTKGLEGETAPEIRSALLYRITFTFAERMGNLEEALKWGDKTVTTALQNDLDEVAYNYHVAWAYIVRSDVYAHAGKFENFVVDSQKAYDILEKGIATLEKQEDNLYNYWLIDYRLSLFNMSIHQVYTGDELNEYDHSRIWYAKMSDIMKTMPKIMLFDTFHWVDYHRNKYEIANALKACEEGIQDAIELKHGQIYVYKFCAADFSYRMGNSAKANEYFQSAKAYRPIYNDLFMEISMNWFIANCYTRLEAYAEAAELYQKELQNTDNEEYKIKLNGQLAWIAAKRGNTELFEENINKTIDLAVAYGEQNLLLKVVTLAGNCLHEMHKTQEAKDAYNQAFSLISSLSEEAQDAQLNQAYLLDLYIGYMVENGYDENMTARALKMIPKALDDLESWWNLPRLLPFATTFLKNNTTQKNTKLTEGIDTFTMAIQQRVDINEAVISV
ncbi:hypothetical protein EZY14_008955 [Kordia sp. TARA_039_SRF]|nr:hypothetical protein EZY14_008955 [Kordia sp. TARA_039_SRF]